MINIPISDLLQKEMDRKDFIKTLAVGAVALTGISAALRAVSSLTPTTSRHQGKSFNSDATAFGNSAYGGTANK